jgi:hypothetical protein
MPHVRLFAVAIVALLVADGANAQVAPPQTGYIARPEYNRGRPAPPPKPDAQMQALADMVNKQLSKRQGYLNGDMISGTDAEPILRECAKQGWSEKDLSAIRARLVPENSVLMRSMRTKGGIKFMRHVARDRGGYDRADRLSRMTDGPTVMWRLTETGEEGYKLIDYMANAPGGYEMGVMLSRDPNAGNFNQPTGRIYTADALVTELNRTAPKK